MANRTVNREPMEVSIPSNSAGFFNTAQFKGLCDNRNEVSIDQQTFAAMENMFVSDNDVLTSRPPLRFYDDKTNIIYEWYFGQFGFRVYKYFREYTDTGYKTLETLEGADLENTYLYYKLECITHELVMNPDKGQYNYMSWAIKYTEAGVDAIPKITPAQIEDKIYFWFADMAFVCYNVVGNYFEQAEKYVYVPVTDLVTNGIISSLESDNYLTETHKKRYLYSTISGINFQQMSGKRVSVSLNSEQTQNSSKHLYDTTLNPNSKDTLIYPYSQIGNDYIIDMVETARAMVILRYSPIFSTIEVSFDGSSWRNLPALREIVGNPCLTKDGLSAVAFTRTGLAMYKLVAQDSDDFVSAESFSWVIHNYCRYAQKTTGQGGVFVVNGTVVIDEIDTTKTPRGDFMTSDQFCYVVWAKNNGLTTGSTAYLPVMYSEWLAGTSGVQSAFYLLNYNADGAGANWQYLMGDNYNIKFKYVTPTPDNKTAAPVISLMTPLAGETSSPNSLVTTAIYAFIYKRDYNQRSPLIRSNDLIQFTESDSPFYIFRFGTDGKTPDPYGNITEGDIVGITPTPMDTSDPRWQWIQGYAYGKGEVASIDRSGTLFCYRSLVNNNLESLPTGEGSNAYWEFVSGAVYGDWSFTNNGGGTTTIPDASSLLRYSLNRTTRYKISHVNSTDENFYPNQQIRLTPLNETLNYTAIEAQNYFGNFNWADGSWDTSYKAGNLKVETNTLSDEEGYYYICHMSATSILERTAQLLLDSEGASYSDRTFVSPCENFDYVVSDPTYSGDKITFTLYAAYNQLTGADNVPQDVYSIISFTNENAEDTTYTRTVIPKLSNQFKMKQNSTDYITDQYLYIGGEIVELPKNGELSQYVDDDERSLVSGDNLVVFNYFNSTEIVLSGKAIKAKDGKSTVGIIRSGDRVLMNDDNYLIQHMANDGSNNWTIISGPLNISTLVRLRSSTTSYPAAPTDWTLGDDWPTTTEWQNIPKPVLIDIETGEYREWKAGDALPSGFINYWGKLGIERIVTPLYYGSLGTWYVIDGTLWTSSLQSNISLELDELLDATSDGLPKMNYTTPDHFMQLSEYFFSFVNPDGRFLLEVTETRRDVEKLFSEEGRDFLLYLPKSNEQPFSQKITNLHPISDASMAVFTDNEIYYVSPVELNTGKVAYTAPVKSKIPLGCRDGSDVVTALDGQVILFSAPKGIAAMEPQDFVATTERTIKYLSDAIQSEYTHFYNDIIPSARLMPWDDSAPKGYDPMIKIATYKYWLIFYRYMYNVCLAFDTRTGTWWKWSTQYPIIKVDVGERLHFIQQIDFNPTEQLEIVFPPPKLPLYGRNFVWCDREIENNSIAYLDDIVAGALDGNVYKDNGGRNIFRYAEPIIRWSFTSQRLHFGQINNYKLIKAINMSAQGDSVMTARLTTKAFRDYYHPEKSEVVEIKISDLRTYIRRMNIMHCVYFQYSLSNDVAVDTQAQLRLNSLSVKYELKERVR